MGFLRFQNYDNFVIAKRVYFCTVTHPTVRGDPSRKSYWLALLNIIPAVPSIFLVSK